MASFVSSFKGDKAYVLTIFDEQAWIYRWGICRYFGLGGVNTHLDLNSINELQAVCTSDKDGRSSTSSCGPRLRMIVDADDQAPLPNGGLAVAVMAHETAEASVTGSLTTSSSSRWPEPTGRSWGPSQRPGFGK